MRKRRRRREEEEAQEEEEQEEDKDTAGIPAGVPPLHGPATGLHCSQIYVHIAPVLADKTTAAAAAAAAGVVSSLAAVMGCHLCMPRGA